MPGFNFVKVRIEGKGKYDLANKPYIDFNAVVAGTEKQRRFIADDRAVANIIIGDPKKQAPVTDANWGHFHEESPEFWFILLGKMEYKIGSLPDLPRRSRRHRLHARSNLASGPLRGDGASLPARDERLSGSAAQLPAAGEVAEHVGQYRMPMFDRVTWNPKQMNGQPCIRGMRLTVRRVVAAVAVYPDREDLFRNYPDLQEEDVRQALEFAAANLAYEGSEITAA